MISSKWSLFIVFALRIFAADNNLLIRNATVHPVSGSQMEGASILVLDGKISEIGAKIVPPKVKNVKVIDAKGLHVYPGMIDSGSLVGISEISSVRETSDYGDVGDFNPQLRTLIAVNPDSEHIAITRANGITSTLVLPAQAAAGGRGASAGSIIGGQASLMHLTGWTWEEMEINRSAGMHLRFPAIASRSFNFETQSLAQGNYQQARQNKEAEVRKLKDFFQQARRYKLAKDSKSPDFKTDLKYESMIPVLEGKLPVVIFAVREREIKEAIDFAAEQKIKIILAGVRRPGKQTEIIAQKKIPVILGTTLAAPLEEDDPYDAAYTLPAQLQKAGVKIAFASFGTEFARNLPYEAAMAVNFGLPYEEGLKALTLNSAEIWGVADRFGSIDKGKVADLIITDGDPLEVRTQVKMMFVKGEAVDLDSKHTDLYRKYLARP
jgi:imidazolonepropionase-like amidohydrolase